MKIKIKVYYTEKEFDYFVNNYFKKNRMNQDEFDRIIKILKKEKFIKYFRRKENVGKNKVKGNLAPKLTKKGKYFLLILREMINNEDAK